MTIYATFPERYGIAEEYQFGTGRASTDGLSLTNRPDFDSGLTVIDERIATGTPYRKTIEYAQSIKIPTTTLELNAIPDEMDPLLHSLFQNVWCLGYEDLNSTPFTKLFLVPTHLNSFFDQMTQLGTGTATGNINEYGTSFWVTTGVFVDFGVRSGDFLYITDTAAAGVYRINSCASNIYLIPASAIPGGPIGSITYYIYRGQPYFFSLARDFQVASEGHQLISSICRGMTFSGDTGGAIKISAEVVSRDLDTTEDTTTGHSFTLSTDVPLLQKDMNVLIASQDGSGDQINSATTAVTFATKTLTISGNVSSSYSVGDYVTFKEFFIDDDINTFGVIESNYSVTLDSTNKYIDFTENGGAEKTATLKEGTYNSASLAAMIGRSLNDVSGIAGTYVCSHTSVTRKYTISVTGLTTFNILWKSGTNGADGTGNTIGSTIGYSEAADDSGALTYTSDTELHDGSTDNLYTITISGTDASTKTYSAIELAREIEEKINADTTTTTLFNCGYDYQNHKFILSTRNSVNGVEITSFELGGSFGIKLAGEMVGWGNNNNQINYITSSAAVGSNTGAYRIASVTWTTPNTIIVLDAMDTDIFYDGDVCKIYAWKKVNVDNFSVTLSNNCVTKNYNNQLPSEYIFGVFTVEGNMSIPWSTNNPPNQELENFINGYMLPIILCWGDSAEVNPIRIHIDGRTDSEFVLAFPARRSDVGVGGDDEITDTMNFMAVDKNSNTEMEMIRVINASGVAENWYQGR